MAPAAKTDAATAADVEQIFSGIGCTSVADVELPSTSSAYFKLDEGVHKIRVLQGPVLSYISQVYDETEGKYGEKKFYKYDDPAAKEDSNAKLQMTYLVWDYKVKDVVVWEINQKSILEQIQSINGIQPDLSQFDIQVTRKKENGITRYSIAQGPNSPFEIKEAIESVTAKNILVRLEELKPDVDAEEAAIEAEVEAPPEFK